MYLRVIELFVLLSCHSNFLCFLELLGVAVTYLQEVDTLHLTPMLPPGQVFKYGSCMLWCCLHFNWSLPAGLHMAD